MHIKALARKNLANKQQSLHMSYTFAVHIGKENFGEWLVICQIYQFFPSQNFPMYSKYLEENQKIKCFQHYCLTFLIHGPDTTIKACDHDPMLNQGLFINWIKLTWPWLNWHRWPNLWCMHHDINYFSMTYMTRIPLCHDTPSTYQVV